jgi:hypothetical protein
MNDILKIFDGLLHDAQAKSKHKPPDQKIFTYKHCIALVQSGWRAVRSRKIGDGSDGVMITWSKDGHNNLEMPLAFSEQCLWVKYMENNK